MGRFQRRMNRQVERELEQRWFHDLVGRDDDVENKLERLMHGLSVECDGCGFKSRFMQLLDDGRLLCETCSFGPGRSEMSMG